MKELIWKGIINKGKQSSQWISPLYWKRLSKKKIKKASSVQIKMLPVGVWKTSDLTNRSELVTLALTDPHQHGSQHLQTCVTQMRGSSFLSRAVNTGWNVVIAWLGMTNYRQCNSIKIPTNQCGKTEALSSFFCELVSFQKSIFSNEIKRFNIYWCDYIQDVSLFYIWSLTKTQTLELITLLQIVAVVMKMLISRGCWPSFLAVCIPSWGRGVCPLSPLNDGNINHSRNVVPFLSSFISKLSSGRPTFINHSGAPAVREFSGVASTVRLTNCPWIEWSKAPSTLLLSPSPDKCSWAASPRHMPPSHLLLAAIRWPALHSRAAHHERFASPWRLEAQRHTALYLIHHHHLHPSRQMPFSPLALEWEYICKSSSIF